MAKAKREKPMNTTNDANMVDEMIDGAAAEAEAAPAKKFAPPQGYEAAGGDVKGYYDTSTAINWRPDYAVAVDNTEDNKKVSILVIGTLLDANRLNSSEGPVEAEPGDLVGVWYRPGMKGLSDCGGVPTYMYPDGVKDTGKKQPMAVFRVFRTGKGRPIAIREDKRKFSRNAELTFGNLVDSDGDRPTFPSDDEDVL